MRSAAVVPRIAPEDAGRRRQDGRGTVGLLSAAVGAPLPCPRCRREPRTPPPRHTPRERPACRARPVGRRPTALRGASCRIPRTRRGRRRPMPARTGRPGRFPPRSAGTPSDRWTPCALAIDGRSCGGHVRSPPTMTRRAAGRSVVALREGGDEVGQPPAVEERAHEQHHRLTRRSGVTAGLPIGDPGWNDDDSRRVNAEPRFELRPGELRVGEDDRGGVRGPAGQQPAAQSFPGAKPFGVRDKRDVVDRDRERRRDADRGGVGRREEHVERVAPGGPPQMRLLPPRSTPGASSDEPDINRARREREGQRLRARRARNAGRRHRAGPSTARAARQDSARRRSLRRAARARRYRLTGAGSRARSAPFDRRPIGFHQARRARVPADTVWLE